jgi:hypothetical protein
MKSHYLFWTSPGSFTHLCRSGLMAAMVYRDNRAEGRRSYRVNT